MHSLGNHGSVVLLIFHSNLSLSIRSQPRHNTILPDLPHKIMRVEEVLLGYQKHDSPDNNNGLSLQDYCL